MTNVTILKYININKSQYQVIQTLKTIKWLCDSCDSFKDNLTMKQRDSDRLIKIEHKLNDLNNQIKELTAHVNMITDVKKDQVAIRNEISRFQTFKIHLD